MREETGTYRVLLAFEGILLIFCQKVLGSAKSGPQAVRMQLGSSGRSGKQQQQEQNPPNLGLTFSQPCTCYIHTDFRISICCLNLVVTPCKEE